MNDDRIYIQPGTQIIPGEKLRICLSEDKDSLALVNLRWGDCRVEDKTTGKAFPLAADASGRPYYQRNWLPFLALAPSRENRKVLMECRKGGWDLTSSCRPLFGRKPLWKALMEEQWSDEVLWEMVRGKEMEWLGHECTSSAQTPLETALSLGRFGLARSLMDAGAAMRKEGIEKGLAWWALTNPVRAEERWVDSYYYSRPASIVSASRGEGGSRKNRKDWRDKKTIPQHCLLVLDDWIDRAAQASNPNAMREFTVSKGTEGDDDAWCVRIHPLAAWLLYAPRMVRGSDKEKEMTERLAVAWLRAGGDPGARMNVLHGGEMHEMDSTELAGHLGFQRVQSILQEEALQRQLGNAEARPRARL